MSRYIDADALRKEIGEIRSEAEEKLNGVDPKNIACRLVYTTQLNERDNLLSLVNWMPTADVVDVRHGEWIPQYEGSSLMKCSACGYEFCDLIECGNYCGNCGAKMDGERKEL